MSYLPDDHGGILKVSVVMLGLTRITRSVHLPHTNTHKYAHRQCINFTKNNVNSVPPVVYLRNAQWINLSAEIR